MKNCDVMELRERLIAGTEGSLIDVREYPEFAAGRIPGALWVPLGQVSKTAKDWNRSQTLYVVCRSGRRSLQAQQQLLQMGFQNVINVQGGVTDWQAKGFAVEREANPPWALERQVRLVAGALVLLGVLLSLWVGAGFIWLSAFVGAGLIFAALTDSCAMAMMLSRLPWNRPLHLSHCPIESATTKE
ncbi:MAG: rhodanese-like domain-containing protein [Acidobacteria bacterium]|nr:rhodanese-like domain-containing protein [Acidobacteriota bacterium]